MGLCGGEGRARRDAPGRSSTVPETCISRAASLATACTSSCEAPRSSLQPTKKLKDAYEGVEASSSWRRSG
jgi:hypothetical protein